MSYSDFITKQQPHLDLVKKQVQRRWQDFTRNRSFCPFELGKATYQLEDEFHLLHQTRQDLWQKSDYEKAKHLLAQGRVRAPECIAFAYNNTVNYYNASTIYLYNRYCIACEGPCEKNVPDFFQLLTTCQVAGLVRLTDASEGLLEKCYPYWKNHLIDNHLHVPSNGGSFVVRKWSLPHWKDHCGIDADDLLPVVLQAKEIAEQHPNQMLAIHCSAGVGRTGTFLAALAIVDAIDRKQPFSIEEIVFYLSLQRVYSVASADQYITLHRLAEAYL